MMAPLSVHTGSPYTLATQHGVDIGKDTDPCVDLPGKAEIRKPCNHRHHTTMPCILQHRPACSLRPYCLMELNGPDNHFSGEWLHGSANATQCNSLKYTNSSQAPNLTGRLNKTLQAVGRSCSCVHHLQYVPGSTVRPMLSLNSFAKCTTVQ